MEDTPSEFGKGFIYPLALFVGHQMHLVHLLNTYRMGRKSNPGEESEKFLSDDRAAQLWIYGAADHLFEFDPDGAPSTIIREKAVDLKDKVMKMRLPFRDEGSCTLEIAQQLIDDALEIFLLVDDFYGNKPIKADIT